MFATFRREARDGEIVCVSNTSLPPLSGSQINRFACNACRAKKLKCSAHRFGCDRCRDRNITCTYSASLQAQRPQSRRISRCQTIVAAKTSHDVSWQREDGVPKNHVEIVSQKDHAPKTTEEHEKSNKVITLTPPDTDSGFQESNTVRQDGCRERSHVPSDAAAAVTPVTPATSSDLTFLDSIMTDISAFDSTYPILGLDSVDGTSDSYSDSTLSPIGSSETRATADHSGMNTVITFPDEREWDVMPDASGKQRADVNARCLFPRENVPQYAKTKDYSPSASRKASTVPIPTVQTCNREYECASSRAVSHNREITLCECMEMILRVLENTQNHSKVNDLSIAEQSLYFVKGAAAQCGSKIQCKSCWYDSRAITFSILLLEKLTGILEEISRSWEDNMPSLSSTRKHSSRRDEPQSHDQDEFVLGGYRINTMQEKCDIFGFLIMVQVKQLAAFTKILSDRVQAPHGNKHHDTLRPVIVRIQELHRALSDTIGILHIN